MLVTNQNAPSPCREPSCSLCSDELQPSPNHTKQLWWQQCRNSWSKLDFSNRFKSIIGKHESCPNTYDAGGCRGSRGCEVLTYGANSQGSAGAQDPPVPACQTPCPCQKALVTQVLISTHTFCRGRCFCSPELVLNTQVAGR